jgi:hypothetical protein
MTPASRQYSGKFGAGGALCHEGSELLNPASVARGSNRQVFFVAKADAWAGLVWLILSSAMNGIDFDLG